jgi:hypothetical protein
MSVSLRKAPAVPASASEGLTILAPFAAAGGWQTRTPEFLVETVGEAVTPGLVWLSGEYQDAIGGHEFLLVPAGRALVLA